MCLGCKGPLFPVLWALLTLLLVIQAQISSASDPASFEAPSASPLKEYHPSSDPSTTPPSSTFSATSPSSYDYTSTKYFTRTPKASKCPFSSPSSPSSSSPSPPSPPTPDPSGPVLPTYSQPSESEVDQEGDPEREQALLQWLMEGKGPLDTSCTSSRSSYFFRSFSGGCNWLQQDQAYWGQAGTALSRDYFQNSFKDGISEPRDGPNPRELSNAFFKRKSRIYYEHTPILVGMVEFVIHDITTTGRSKDELIEIPVPRCDEYFDAGCQGNKTMTMWRTEAVPGTGTGFGNPRENINHGSAWLDLSPLYGSSLEVNQKLRVPDDCRMKVQKGPDGGDYPPFNHMGVPMNGWGQNPGKLFAGGDPRTNQDWLLMAVHTLLLREHNRICGLLEEEYPTWSSEKLFQYARHLNIAHYTVALNSYQRAYFTKEMTQPQEDGFGLFRAWFNQSSWFVNPYHVYPWEKTLVKGRPLVTSQELAIGYRFHDLIPDTFPLVDEENRAYKDINVAKTTFDAEGFLSLGISPVLRGMAGSSIPNFHSGVSDDLRSHVISYALPQEGRGYDMVAWTIVQERERGLPTFNEYFRKYPGKVPVKIREKFEDFTSDPKMVAELKRLYKSPDDVDFIVGLQLDEEYYPGTTVPRTMLIASLFSLLGVGTSDRFSVAYSSTVCILAGKPWDCTPLNPVDEMLWKPFELPPLTLTLSLSPLFNFSLSLPLFKGGKIPFFPRARWGSRWFEELDLANAGDHAIWNLVTKNTPVKCLQINPLFPADPETNPVVCSLPTPPRSWFSYSFASAALLLVLFICSRLVLKLKRFA